MAADEVVVHERAKFVEKHGTQALRIETAPAEVEEFLLTVDGVAQVAVVGAPDPARGEIVVAFVVPEPGRELQEQELVEACRGSLASYKVPARVSVVDDLPKTGTGKLHRVKLREAVQPSGRP